MDTISRRDNPGESRTGHFDYGSSEAYDASGKKIVPSPSDHRYDDDAWAAWNKVASNTVSDPRS